MIDSDPTAALVESGVETSAPPEEIDLDQFTGVETIQIPSGATLTGNGTVGAAAAEMAAESVPVAAPEMPAAPPVTRPVPPIPLTKRKVSGRYHSTGIPWQVELRVDIDGPRPTMRVSADYYHVAGATLTYFGSMRVDAPAITITPTLVTITGLGTYTWAAGAPRVTITIPRVFLWSPPAAATLHHSTIAGAPGATYVCPFARALFRTVLLDQDRQDTVPAPFVSYNTGSLPSGGPARTLTVGSAYAEAGIEMQTGGVPDVVPTAEAGVNGSWSNAELHAAMQHHFELWRDLPQWCVWLFHAQLHDLGPGLLGIMFDQIGKQRQGCAVFYQGLAGATPDQQRLQLYTCTHELGHCFNLLHSWQKSLAMPPGTDRPNALSYMNYPWRYPGGSAAFWSGFAFQFDDQEIVHLRHGFRDNVIMGGNDFLVGSSLSDPEAWRPPVEDNSGLKLELETPRSFLFGEPVSVQLTLSATDTRGKQADAHLHPSVGMVEIGIRKPNNQVVAYRPLIYQCVEEAPIILDQERPSVTESAFIGYGQDGFYFDQPGFYQLRARYSAPDCSTVLSNISSIRVRNPLTEADEAVADLFFGDEQGTLLYLVGSDYEGLAHGNDAFREVREQYPEHPLAQYAQLVQGVNLAREFKNVTADNRVEVRPSQPDEAAQLLSPVVDVGAVQAMRTEVEVTPETVQVAAAALRQMAEERHLPPGVATYIDARKSVIATEIVGMGS